MEVRHETSCCWNGRLSRSIEVAVERTSRENVWSQVPVFLVVSRDGAMVEARYWRAAVFSTTVRAIVVVMIFEGGLEG